MRPTRDGGPPRPTAYFGCLDAEALWRDPSLATLPEVKDGQAQRIVAALDELQFVLCAAGDLLLTASPVQPGHEVLAASLGLRLVHATLPREDQRLPEDARTAWSEARPSPWAVVPGLEATCARLGMTWDCPKAEVAQRVNSKTFSHELAASMGLFGAGRLVRSTRELVDEGLRLLHDGPCVVKHPFGVSGRAALVLRAGAEVDRLAVYLGRQVEAGKRVELLVQPLYDRAADFSCHFEVDATGLSLLYGAQRMTNDGLAFSSVRPASGELLAELERKDYWAVMERIAKALASGGYRGPACVDSMVLRDGTLLPLLEINARKSMGLLNIRLNALAKSGLFSTLGQVGLTLRRKLSLEELLDAMRRDGLLYDGSREGLLPLGGGPLLANQPLLDEAPERAVRGRLYLSTLSRDEAGAARLHDALLPCLASLGVQQVRKPHA